VLSFHFIENNANRKIWQARVLCWVIKQVSITNVSLLVKIILWFHVTKHYLFWQRLTQTPLTSQSSSNDQVLNPYPMQCWKAFAFYICHTYLMYTASVASTTCVITGFPGVLWTLVLRASGCCVKGKGASRVGNQLNHMWAYSFKRFTYWVHFKGNDQRNTKRTYKPCLWEEDIWAEQSKRKPEQELLNTRYIKLCSHDSKQGTKAVSSALVRL
jgi:hypothetical protein